MRHQTPGPDWEAKRNRGGPESSQRGPDDAAKHLASRPADVSATAHDFYRPLPARPRLLHLETPSSYLRRLITMNQLRADTLNHWITQAHVVAPGNALADSTRLVARAKGNLKPSAFEHALAQIPKHPDGSSCPRCVAGIERRYMCRLCARGETVEQYPHMKTNVCHRHLLWTGPGTIPETQVKTGQAALRADRTYRHLQKLGVLDALRFLELRSTFRRWADATGPHIESVEQCDAAIYPMMMAVAGTVLAPAYVDTLLDPRRTFASAYDLLETSVERYVQSNPGIVTDGLWLLFRPAFLTVREQCGENNGRTGVDPHSMPIPIVPAGTIANVIRPLEPFRRFLEPLSSCHRDRWVDTNLTLYDSGRLPVSKDQMPSPSSARAVYICANGHRGERPLHTMAVAVRHGWSGCPYCCNALALDGYNSLAQTHPALAGQWHPSLNAPTRPSDVIAGGNSAKYWWQCPQDHVYEESPNNRTRGNGCPYCAHRRAIPGVTSLDAVDPELAQEWHPELNGELTPTAVLPGSARLVWWLCKLHHAYQARIYSRRNGTGCPFCANRKVMLGFNDLNTKRPELAEEWHPTLNEGLTPRDVVAGAIRRVWWECPRHHTYATAVCQRTQGTGCPYCSNKKVLPGDNDLQARFPEIASEWHPTNNGSISPSQVLPGDQKRCWLCAFGHEQWNTAWSRIKARGCTLCPFKDRVLYMPTDERST